jgi:hypothetical protein
MDGGFAIPGFDLIAFFGEQESERFDDAEVILDEQNG